MTITAPLRGSVLGPVEASWGTAPIALGGPRRRALFAALALHVGQVLSVDRLVSLVWGADPPSSAVTKLHGQVSGLRAAIDAVAGSGAGRNVVVTRSPGYLMPADVVSTDVDEFEALVSAAQAVSGRPADTAILYGRALALWRGRVAEDVPCHEPWAVVAAMEARRWQTVESKARADLAAGNADTVVATLAKEVETAPYRETLLTCYVRALYQCGRQVESLDVLRAAHERLRVDLGLDPSPELQRLEAAILRHDPSLAGSPNGSKSPSSLPPGPRTLFGRDTELDALLRISGVPSQHGAVAVVSGSAGIGKTALATAAAHKLRPHYPDGSLYFDLRGNERRHLPPARVMVRTLRALGIDDLSVPDNPEEVLDLYRTTLADRRILLVLDNAGSEAQVRPLIPVSDRCTVLITSRKSLSGLIPSVAVTLTPLAASAALAQFSGLVGAGRAAAEPERTHEILRRCGYVPLAVHLAGLRLAARPHWSIGELAQRLDRRPNSIDALAVGNVRIRTILEEGYRSLSVEAQRAFAVLMSLPAAEYRAWMVMGLSDISLGAATDLLDSLVDHGLMEVSGTGEAGSHRYRANELVRAFGSEFTDQAAPAVKRVFGILLELAEAANRETAGLIRGLGRGPAPRMEASDELLTHVQNDPMAWQEIEYPLILAVTRQCLASGMHALAWNIGCAITHFAIRTGRWTDIAELHGELLATVTDPLAQAHVRWALGEVCLANNREAEGVAFLQRACAELHVLDAWPAEACALGALSEGLLTLGRYDEAARRAGQALRVASTADEVTARVRALVALGTLHQVRGRPDQALRRYRTALVLLGSNSLLGNLQVLRLVGLCHLELGELGPATQTLSEAQRLADSTLDIQARALVSASVADARMLAGAVDEARTVYEAARKVMRRVGHRGGTALTTRGLGRCALAEERYALAEQLLAQAHAEYSALGHPRETALVLSELGQARASTGKVRGAMQAWTEALHIATLHGLPFMVECKAWLKQVEIRGRDTR